MSPGMLRSKSAALVAVVFVNFPKNKCNYFLHKNELDVVRRVQFLTGRRPMRSFLLGRSPPFPYGSRDAYVPYRPIQKPRRHHRHTKTNQTKQSAFVVVISNHNSYRVPLGKIASIYSI